MAIRQPSPEEREELRLLRKAFLTASEEAAAVIEVDGLASDQFTQAQEKVAIIARRIKELLGTAKQS
jgi:hypothetical protein